MIFHSWQVSSNCTQCKWFLIWQKLHSTSYDLSQAGSNCEQCEEVCRKVRPEGCHHSCLLPCHASDCPPCQQRIRMRCHCQLMVLHVECDKWTHGEERTRERLQACPSKCPKTVSFLTERIIVFAFAVLYLYIFKYCKLK